ncbi:catechol 1,2-dioxygenase [Methylobacterium isbiliense]|jgi:catechol 1,2-dioxygenase|uniref:catechol 1,2-dioxygenase n=1 Tax=Methylobacterium isbiliense TaxID=315478 RepID=A0ABQ4SQT6_9HYPH|nr:catechol 1,2-dioxygenase [Methylobacterium isbiliense]MDN3627415.1 catechol 1,2-dioxygenase [Methylobacterium isbiliense]GJE04041.1 Catechol 1,2-dioxygenase 2 [Methylobacterium isbiliense]
MSTVTDSPEAQALFDKVAGLDNDAGNPRIKQIVRRVVADACRIIEDLDITPSEFWTAMSYLTETGQKNEFGLLMPGIGVEHFIDLCIDAKERAAGLAGGTPRTIEGPLYVAGAPLSKGEARLDDDPEDGEVLIVEGQVTGTDGAPLAGAIVDVWHANTLGNYSVFDKSQSTWNLRRRIETDAEGRYRFRSILPKGYGCPPEGQTQKLLDQLGRHGQRPAHIHFFVSGAGHRQLTTQINLADDPYVYDDFAFGTRDGLVVDVVRVTDPAALAAAGLAEPFSTIRFDFALNPEAANAPDPVVVRPHAEAA